MDQHVWIRRNPSTIEGTTGYVRTSDGYTCRSIELPWYANQQDISCIPTGAYNCVYKKSPTKGYVYQVEDVENRSNILIHVGNYAGDVLRQLKSDSEGCILLGTSVARLTVTDIGKYPFKQMAVTNSRYTVGRLFKNMNYKPFTLHIEDIKADELGTPWGGR